MSTKIEMLVRSNQTMDKEYHIDVVKGVPADEVCVLYLGGNGTVDQVYPVKKTAIQVANGDTKRIRSEIVKPFFNDAMGVDIPVYAVAYDFDDEFDSQLEMRHDTGRNTLNVTEKNLRRKLKLILSILSENNKKISIDEIRHRWTSRIRIIFTSAQVESQFNRMLYDNLLELKYTDSEMSDIEKLVQDRILNLNNEHVTDLFNRVILPRITKNGQRRNLNETLIQIRKITFVSHCYGALLVRKLQNEMRRKMPKFGYSPDEIKLILNQMLIVAHAPSGRLDKQTANFYSFASAFDNMMETPNNEIRSFITDHRVADQKIMRAQGVKDMEHTWIPKESENANMRAMFLPQNMGNMFVIPRGFDFDEFKDETGEYSGEHGNTHYVGQPGQNKYGWLLNVIARNILVNGINNSLDQADEFEPLPDLEHLILGPNDTPEQNVKAVKLFKQMQQNGKIFLRNVYEYATEKLRKCRSARKAQPDKSRQT